MILLSSCRPYTCPSGRVDTTCREDQFDSLQSPFDFFCNEELWCKTTSIATVADLAWKKINKEKATFGLFEHNVCYVKLLKYPVTLQQTTAMYF